MPTSPNLRDAILTRINLRDLAEEAGATFRGHATNHSSPCPLHGGDNPTAFHLYAGGTRWHCFTRCPQGKNDGDLITFYMLWKNLDFPSALRDLAHRAGLSDKQSSSIYHSSAPTSNPTIPNPFNPFPESVDCPSPIWQSRAQAFIDYARAQLLHPEIGAPARAYLYSERGLTLQTQEAFQLGYNPTDLFDNPLSWGFNPLPFPIDPRRGGSSYVVDP